MDVVFVIPRVAENTLVIREFKHAGNRQPGSPYTLAEVIGLLREEAPDVDVHVVDAQIDGFSVEEVNRKLEQIDPDLVIGFLSCFDIPTDRQYVEFDDYLTMGIITPCTVDPIEADRIYDLDIDYFTATELENTILNAVREVDETGDPRETPGLYVRTEDGLVSTGPPEWREDDPPMPAFDEAGFEKYYRWQEERGQSPYFLLNTTKGCPFGCEFCMSSTSELSSVKPADAVLDELNYLHKMTGGSRFQFIDDEFPIRLSRAKDICQGMIDFDWDIRFEAMNRVEFLDSELISLLDEAGCYKMSFGIETGDPVVQREINKELDFDHAKAMFDQFSQDTTVKTRAFMTFGLPGERQQTLEKNKEVLRYLSIDDMSCSTLCFPGPSTPLYNRMKAEGRLLVEDWSEYKEPDQMLFEHGYYNSLKEMKDRRNEFQNWWRKYMARRQLRNPTPTSVAKATLDQLRSYPKVVKMGKRSQLLTRLHRNIYGRLDRAKT